MNLVLGSLYPILFTQFMYLKQHLQRTLSGGALPKSSLPPGDCLPHLPTESGVNLHAPCWIFFSEVRWLCFGVQDCVGSDI